MILSGKKKREVKNRIASSDKFLLSGDSPFVVQEAYKALRTNVAFSLPGGECKVIGVTSAERGDGKSSNAINVACSFAQMGKRVVIIDCDMRLPTVASKIGIKGQPGLSDLLVGECEVGKALRRVEKLNLDVLPAGNIPPDPTRLLESKQIEVLLQELKKYYDYVFIDLPPINTVADAAILSRHIDGFLLVVRHEKTEYREVSEMLNQLRFVNAKIIGFVYNDAETEGKKYYRYGKK